MPFDSTDLRIPEIDPATYQARRAQAAMMWLRILPEDFNMRCFRSCALGWLATWELDGWYWDKQTGEPRCRVVADYAKNDDPYAHAAMYFGLTVKQADLCFGWDRWTAIFHCRWRIERVGPEDVVRTLRSLPVTVPAELLRVSRHEGAQHVGQET